MIGKFKLYIQSNIKNKALVILCIINIYTVKTQLHPRIMCAHIISHSQADLLQTLPFKHKMHKVSNWPQHTHTSHHMCLHTSCNLHFCMFSAWFLLHTCPKYVCRNWSVQSDRQFVYFGRQVHWADVWSSHSRDSLVLFSVTLLMQPDPSSVWATCSSKNDWWTPGGNQFVCSVAWIKPQGSIISAFMHFYLFFVSHFPPTLVQHTANPSGNDN